MESLRGKTVVITGAASGIGEALARELAARGARLMLADIDAARLEALAAELASAGADCDWSRCDSADEAALMALAGRTERRFGAADVLVNNAGVALVAPVGSLDAHDAHWLMGVNFWGVVHGCRAFLPQLRARPEAVVVNVSSIFAMVSVPTQSMYNASKAAVRAFSDSLREELRDTPVRVLCVHPGGIRTAISRNARIVDLAMVADSAEQMHANFERNARTTPREAALQILLAIARRRTRLLIGFDAILFDLAYRLAPARASSWVTGLMRRMRARRGSGSAASHQ
jgi:NADP-dependent 3-hydroxy acid dehydrogenase YdfG